AGPSDISTERTSAWSPPTRAVDAGRWAACGRPSAPGAAAGAEGRRDLAAWRRLAFLATVGVYLGQAQAGGWWVRTATGAATVLASTCLRLSLGHCISTIATTCCVPMQIIPLHIDGVKPQHPTGRGA